MNRVGVSLLVLIAGAVIAILWFPGWRNDDPQEQAESIAAPSREDHLVTVADIRNGSGDGTEETRTGIVQADPAPQSEATLWIEDILALGEGETVHARKVQIVLDNSPQYHCFAESFLRFVDTNAFADLFRRRREAGLDRPTSPPVPDCPYGERIDFNPILTDYYTYWEDMEGQEHPQKHVRGYLSSDSEFFYRSGRFPETLEPVPGAPILHGGGPLVHYCITPRRPSHPDAREVPLAEAPQHLYPLGNGLYAVGSLSFDQTAFMWLEEYAGVTLQAYQDWLCWRPPEWGCGSTFSVTVLRDVSEHRMRFVMIPRVVR